MTIDTIEKAKDEIIVGCTQWSISYLRIKMNELLSQAREEERLLTEDELRIIQFDYINFLMITRKVSGQVEMLKPLETGDRIRQHILEKIDKTIGQFSPEKLKIVLSTLASEEKEKI